MKLHDAAKNGISMVLALGLSATCFLGTADAEQKYTRVYDAHARKYVYVADATLKDKTRSKLRNPIVKQGLIGAGVGAAAGLLGDRVSVGKGALVGGIVGVSTGAMTKSKTLSNKPLLRKSLKGAAIGTGVSVVAKKGLVKGAAAGAATGAGLHFLDQFLNRND